VKRHKHSSFSAFTFPDTASKFPFCVQKERKRMRHAKIKAGVKKKVLSVTFIDSLESEVLQDNKEDFGRKLLEEEKVEHFPTGFLTRPHLNTFHLFLNFRVVYFSSASHAYQSERERERERERLLSLLQEEEVDVPSQK
jgi:hypothetical protein